MFWLMYDNIKSIELGSYCNFLKGSKALCYCSFLVLLGCWEILQSLLQYTLVKCLGFAEVLLLVFNNGSQDFRISIMGEKKQSSKVQEKHEYKANRNWRSENPVVYWIASVSVYVTLFEKVRSFLSCFFKLRYTWHIPLCKCKV